MSRAHVAHLSGARAPRAGRPARAGLAVALVASAVLAGVLAVRGLSWVNLDSLLAEPGEFYALLVAPALLAMAGLVIALPRIVAVNVAVFVALIVCGELAARSLGSGAPALTGEPEAIGAPAFYVPDPDLGYALVPSTAARHRRMEGDRVAYEVTYRTDERGRRETPVVHDGPHEAFLAFFGDSNTFGEGLAQDETLPSQAGALAPGYRSYNYGVPGYGPAQLLTLAAKRRFADEIAEPQGYAVYLLIPAHVARVVGAMPVSTGWGRHFPYYVLGPGGELQSHSDFVHARAFTTLGYYFWSRSSLAARLGAELPLRYTAYDYRLTAKILAESSRMLARELHVRRFVVVLGQVFNDPQRRIIDAMRDALAAEGIATLDYTRLFDANDRRYRVSELDYHNSAETNRVLAARLVSDLGITR